MSSSLPLLDKMLRTVARRYRLAAIPGRPTWAPMPSASDTLAMVMEEARTTLSRKEAPDPGLKAGFIDALARAIENAMRPEHGDPAFQAIVLRHRSPAVRAFATLSGGVERDHRTIRKAVDALTHPGRPTRYREGPCRDALARLHACASSAAWAALADAARQLLAMPQVAADPALVRGATRLLDNPALDRLQRLAALACDEPVLEYRLLWEQHGPRSGTAAATERGLASQRRGAAVEASAARALHALATMLSEAEGTPRLYRVATSVRVPASIPGNAEHAKSEWDAVLLRQAEPPGDPPLWDVCLVAEVKASIEAATKDLPRLVRGLELLAGANGEAVYTFATHQGPVRVRGASLMALEPDDATLSGKVLYCCDAPAPETPRLLSAASRMQLLCAAESLAFASRLAGDGTADRQVLEPLWAALLTAPRWRPVLHQYAAMRRARELMVHIDDLAEALVRAGAGS